MDFFWLQVVLSFIVGGAYIALSLKASEKLGSKWGDILIGMPTTTLVGLAFICWIQGVDAAVSATPIMPLTLALGPLFLAAFVALSGFGAIKAWFAAIGFWLLLATPLAFFGFNDIWVSLALAAIVYVPVLQYMRKIPHMKLENQKSSKTEFLGRVIFSGAVVATSVALAKTAGPLWGGLFATFPVAFSSAVLLLSRKHGIGFTKSVIKSMPLGNIAAIAFAVSAYLVLPAFGFVMGITASFLVSLVVASLLAFGLKNY